MHRNALSLKRLSILSAILLGVDNHQIGAQLHNSLDVGVFGSTNGLESWLKAESCASNWCQAVREERLRH